MIMIDTHFRLNNTIYLAQLTRKKIWIMKLVKNKLISIMWYFVPAITYFGK